MSRSTLRTALGLLFVFALALSAFRAPDPAHAAPAKKGKKYALLAGVNEYETKHLRKLSYAENDVRDLAAELTKAGYAVVLLTASDEKNLPTRENIEKHLDALLAKMTKHDLLLVGFAGHGMQFDKKEDSFFCPYDARVTKPDTLLSMRAVYKKLGDSEVGTGLLLVDACRDAGKERAATRGVDGDKLPNPPKGAAALFSCSAGQFAWESPKYKHGVFFHHVLAGLAGGAKDKDDEITWASLSAYVSKKVATDVPELIGGGANQEPFEMKNLGGVSPQLVPPGSVTNALGMKLVRVPAGEFEMGSKESAEEIAKAYGEAVKNFEAEHPRHKVRITRPMYVGRTEVTVKQFRAFVEAKKYETDAEKNGTGGSLNPNSGERNDKDAKKANWRKPDADDTKKPADDEPVRLVSWNDAAAFCEWLSKKEGKRYRLLTEAEWEYCCRAGTSTRYYNGDDPEKLIEIANVPDATFLEDHKKRKPNEPLGYKTLEGRDGYAGVAPVGKFAANAFGLHDMHGNVWEWCDDWYEAKTYNRKAATDPKGPAKGDARVIRGGCFM